MNWNLFASTFTLIFLAELPDKTAFATLMLAGEGRFAGLFWGAATAFFIHCSLAVLVGGMLSSLPIGWIHLGAGILFLIFSGIALRRARVTEPESSAPILNSNSIQGFMSAFLKTFSVIFIAETGDITQLATASLTAKYHDRITILAGSVLALWSVTGIALVLGKKLQGVIDPRKFQTLLSLILGLTGIYFIAEFLMA